ncbi:hypothetical protein E2R62_02560 [Citrobacter rodentium]|uniref:Uncharacterized protein n=1 Tax=Citrobacter rodentium TaxID=67825 RepID=A0A482PC41_CITRO|nr:hypothetical protein E2R62_02560 [Citrobacter rodentium]HAT8012911.1 hypothetical protein [Citrobacter rodentium NBRC 105723 = DSM 16636]HAT8020195.1 hypothetical protein [Citrobacter rodentium]HAT8029988.1 hypothetical protein [Citrobacter rodentium]HAT8032855.1 hypothetical protein [Citrobacter rodentium]
MQSPSLFVTTLSGSHKRQILRQVTFIPANENISLPTLTDYNKDWRLQWFAVECPPSLRVTRVVNHKPRIGQPSVASTWDRVKN